MVLQRFADNDVFSSLRDIQRLQQQLSRAMSVGDWSTAREFPAINVWTSENGAVARTEIPGFDASDIDVSMVNDILTVRGARNPDSLPDGHKCHRQERDFCQFSRSLKLPFAVEADKVQAHFSNGVLEITLPRAEADKPRKIGVISE